MSTALVDWTLIDGRDAPDVPQREPLLVRVPGLHEEHYVAVCQGRGVWVMSGAADRRIYGVDAWARVESAAREDAA